MLRFPNASRDYQASKQSVCFWGYDSAFEVSFLIGHKALQRLDSRPDSSEATSEADLLRIFDANRPWIQQVAEKAYSRWRGNYYPLEPEDF